MRERERERERENLRKLKHCSLMSLRDITNFTSHMSKKKQEEISRRVTERERVFRIDTIH